MKRPLLIVVIILAIALITGSAISCSNPNGSSNIGKNTAIEEVKDSLTSDVEGNYKAVKYENGYVVNFDNIAYWYIEDGVVWSLNGFAKTYAEHTEYKYGIDWDKLFE